MAEIKLFEKKSLEKKFGYALVFGILACFIIGLVLEEIVLGIIAGFFGFAVSLGLMILRPIMHEKKRVALIERDLPLALMSISTDLDLNIAFEKCVFNASKSGLKTAPEFAKIFLEIREKGASVQESLVGFAKRNKSIPIKRTVLQLASFYEHGSRGKSGSRKSAKALRRLAVELLSKQRTESKEFSGKLVVFSLLFIAASAIVPALFQSFVIVGSMILKMSITQTQVLLATIIGFPLLDLTVLLYIRAKTPAALRAE